MAERDEQDGQAEGRRPSDGEALVGDTAASERLTEREGVQPPEVVVRQADGDDRAPGASAGGGMEDRDDEREAELGHS